jgi:hypothetical protein
MFGYQDFVKIPDTGDNILQEELVWHYVYFQESTNNTDIQ